MCGICGWFALSGGSPPGEPELSRMAATLVHRGPDEGGVFLDPGAGLAIRRLCVIDLATGRQPYTNEDATICVVYNGEIYNFQELRAGLEARGHRFRSHTDGEVIVHLYEEQGPDCVDQLNGMFAFALWDEPRQRFLLARDRLGIKPLYYAQSQGLLLFGSELKAILASGRVQRRLDPVALDQYLTFEYVPGPRTIFEGMRKLPPGCRLVGQAGAYREERYWQLRLQPGGPIEPEQFLDGLRASVRRMLVSDVPLGVFLSGGIDSSTLAALMTEGAPGRVKTFSIGFEERSYDESEQARAVARYLGSEHHEEILGPVQVESLLGTLVDLLDEPLADAAIVPTYLLSRFARTRVTVALAGEGADEILCGYPTYQAHQLAAGLHHLPAPVLRGLAWLASQLPVSHRYLSLDYKLKRFFAHLGEAPARRHQLWMGSFSPRLKASLYRPEFRAFLGDGLEPLLAQREALNRLGPMEMVQHLDLHLYLPDNLLVKLDRASMAVSLEGRVPYLDHTLVELAARLPTSAKLGLLSGKKILKRSMRGKLPDRILRRPKKGFGIPVATWFRGRLRPLLQDMLASERLHRQGVFEPSRVQALIQEHQEGRVDRRKELWTLLMLSMWWERYHG